MTYYKRISDNNMNSEFVDGSLLLHTDMNEIETLTKAGINANYEDIQKMQDGTITVQNAVNATNALNATTASTLNGASLSKYADETLQNNDNKVPTSKQVKQYVDAEVVKDYDNLTNRPSINGVVLTGNKTAADLDLDVPFYYWDGTDTPANVAMFNEICQRYTNGYPFMLFGRVEVQNGYYDANGDFVDRTIPVVTEISVKNMEPYESPSSDRTFLSFMTQPIRTTGGYAIGSIHLVGTTWGEYTEIQPMSWSYEECPPIKEETVTHTTAALPTPIWQLENTIIKYEGEQFAHPDLVTGHYYKCISTHTTDPETGTTIYRWKDISKDNYLGEIYFTDDIRYVSPTIPFSDLGIGLYDIDLSGLQPGTYQFGVVYPITGESPLSPGVCWSTTERGYECALLYGLEGDEEDDILLNKCVYLELYYPVEEWASLDLNTVVLKATATYVSSTSLETPTLYVNEATLYRRYTPTSHSSGIDWTHNSHYYNLIKRYTDLTEKPKINNVTLNSNKTSSELGLQDTIQYSTMPTASSTNLGKIAQYIGTTDSTYTNGYYYQVISDGASTPTYSWSRIDVQPSGGGGSALGLHILTSEDGYAIDLSSAEAGDYIREDGMGSISVYFSDATEKLSINTFDGVIHVVKDGSSSVPDYTLLATYCGYNQGEVGYGYVERNSFVYSGLNASYGQAFGLVPNGNNSTIYGKKTFDTIPETVANATPTTDWQLVNKKYVTDRSFYIKKDLDGTLMPCGRHITTTNNYSFSINNNSGTALTMPTTIPVTKRILSLTPRVQANNGSNYYYACCTSQNHAPLEIVECYPYVNTDATLGQTWYFKMSVFNYTGNSVSGIKFDFIYELDEDF